MESNEKGITTSEEYKKPDFSTMSREEINAFFVKARGGTGNGKPIRFAISPSLYDEIEQMRYTNGHGKLCSRAHIIRHLIYLGLEEQKRLDVLGIRAGTKKQKERVKRLDVSAAMEAQAKAVHKKGPEPDRIMPGACILGPVMPWE